MIRTFFAVIQRDLRVGFKNRSELLMPVIFFIIVISLFPLGLGLDSENLIRASAPAILWIAALLATLLVMDRLFKTDFEDGSLEQLVISGHPLYLIVLGKIVGHWLLTSLPLIICTPLLSLMLYFNISEAFYIAGILLLASPLLSLVGGMCVSLVLGLRQAGLLLSIIILPLYIPILIFGVQMIVRMIEGHSLTEFILIGIAANLIAIAVCPLVAAFSVKLCVN